MGRFILHSDLNNFYASVECLHNASIRNCAVVVVGDAKKRHGIVLAKNNIAKKYGIKTGDAIWEAEQKCSEKLVCITADIGKYSHIAKQVKDMYYQYSDRVESFGIDEAWIDISQSVKSFEEAEIVANKLRKQVMKQFGITVSVGVSYNKIFAKLGSDYKKPNAVTVITPQNYKQVLWVLPVENLIYVGRATLKKLKRAGINTIGNLANTSINILKSMLGKNGETLHIFANGKDCEVVRKYHQPADVKSIGNSTTCPKDLKTNLEVEAVICVLAENVAKRMREQKLWASTVCLSIKTADLQSFDVMRKIEYPTNLASTIAKECYALFKFNWHKTIRAVGVRVTGLCEKPTQYSLFVNDNDISKKENFECAIDNLRLKYGYKIITRASALDFKINFH